MWVTIEFNFGYFGWVVCEIFEWKWRGSGWIYEFGVQRGVVEWGCSFGIYQ